MSRLEITKEVSKEGNKSVTYRKSWDKNGIHHSKEVRKVEGGYIVTESKYGTPEDGEEKGEYVDERKEWVTTENPFEAKEEEKDNDEKMFSFIDKPDF